MPPSTHRRTGLAITLIAMLVALAGPAVGRAAGATLYVSKSGGTGPPEGPPYCPEDDPCGSIVTAVGLASPGDTISIGPGLFAEGAGITVSKNLTLTGKGPFGGTYVRSTAADEPVFTIERGATVTISDLQIWKGAEGVSNAGHLTLENVWVRDNKGSLGAGGILNDGTLGLDRSQVAYNEGEGISAGGIRNEGTLTVSRSLVAANRGMTAGIENFSGTLIMSDSLVSKNDGDVGASTGGIRSNGTATLTNVTIANNSGGSVGGFLNWGGRQHPDERHRRAQRLPLRRRRPRASGRDRRRRRGNDHALEHDRRRQRRRGVLPLRPHGDEHHRRPERPDRPAGILVRHLPRPRPALRRPAAAAAEAERRPHVDARPARR